MAADDDVIEHAVVKIGPDLDGFRAKLEKDLATATKGVTAKINVVASGAGLKKSVQEAVTAQMALKDQPVYRVKVHADGRGLKGSKSAPKEGTVAWAVKQQMALPHQPVYKVKVVADEKGLKRSVNDALKNNGGGGGGGRGRGGRGGAGDGDDDGGASNAAYLLRLRMKAIEDGLKRIRTVEEKYERDRQQARIADQQREASRVRNDHEAMARIEEQAYREDADRAKRAGDKRLADEKKHSRDLENERRRRNKELFSTDSRLIDFGGRGIRPMNLLYGTVAAMTPALFAMSASALQASTSIAALGSAGIGAAFGLGGLMVAFQGIGDVLKLRKTVLEQDTTAQANATANTDALAEAKRGLADALRDEKTAQEAISPARREAIRDLEDLRRAVRDLDNQYKSDRISVAEARQNAAAVDRNFFATALDRARARQDLRDAETKLSDTALERRRKKEDLRESVSKGVEGSDKVRAARERARDAHDAVLSARRSVSTAQSAGKVTSAAANLKAKIAELAPAAQEMYYWFDKNEDLFKRLQRQIAQQVLPGFNKFLEALTTPPKGQKSTLQIAADYAGELGAIISKYAGQLGEWMNSPFFRKSMAFIQERNAKAFDKLGQALIPLSSSLVRIIKAASPGFESFADTILKLSIRFDKWTERLEKNGGLTKWFADSRKELAKWWDIAGNILELLKNLLGGSLPSGQSLVDRFQKFTQNLADWSGSANGRKAISDFFDKVAKFPYAKVADFLKNMAALFFALHAFKWLKATNPIFLLIGALAASDPEGFAHGIQTITDAVADLIGWFVEHPKAVAAALALFGAFKVGKALGIKLPGLDLLTSKFKVLDKVFGGGATTGVMTVNANIVNVYGKGVTGGAPGAPGKGGKGGGVPAAAGGLLTGAAIAAIVAAVFADQGFQRARAGEGFTDPMGQFVTNPGLGTLAGTAQLASPVGWAAFALGKAAGKKFFGATIPDWIGAGLIARFPALAKLAAPKLAAQKAGALEGNAYRRLTKDLQATGGFDNATAQASLRTYVTRRKESVEAYVAYIRSTQGPIAAQQAEAEETEKTRIELEKLYKQYGATEEQARKYAETALTVGKNTELATGWIKGYNTELGTLSERINEVTGDKQIVLTIKNKKLIFDTLEQAAAYQQLIRQGKEPNQANLRHQRLIFQKNMATGGRVPGHSPHDKADNIPAWLTANEYVQPVSAVKYYGTDFMDAVRTRQFPRYAGGGSVQQWPFPMKVVVENEPGIGAPIPGYTGAIPKGVGDVSGVIPSVVAATLGAKRYFPSLHVTSGLRKTFTRSGRRSNHWFGHAVDLAPPSLALFNYLKALYGKIAREIIYTPAGHRQVYHGKDYFYRDPGIQKDHYSHVHLALANGGLVPVRKFDTGGTLPPGYTLAFNGTGANETVRTQTQERSVAGPTRIDRRDLALLAHYMASNTTPTITMDGRQVAETTNRYNYLPAGV